MESRIRDWACLVGNPAADKPVKNYLRVVYAK